MRITYIVIFLLYVGVASSQTQVPNVFQAGEPAKASEVNANFDEVELAIDDNASQIDANSVGIAQNSTSLANTAAIKWFAAGELVGSHFLAVASQFEATPITFTMLTVEGYQVNFNSETGQITRDERWHDALFYLTENCEGQAYLRAPMIGYDHHLRTLISGLVVKSPFSGDSNRLYYIEPGSTLIEDQTFLSLKGDSWNGCSTGENTDIDAFPVFPNDPAITGVAAEFFALPMTIGHR